MKKLLVALVMAVAVPVGMTAVTGVEFVPEAQALGVPKFVKKAGKGIKKGAKWVKRTARKGGKKIKGGAKKVFLGDAVGKAMSRYGRKTGRIAKRGGRAFKRNYVKGAKSIGRAKGMPGAFRHLGKCITRQGPCYTTIPGKQSSAS